MLKKIQLKNFRRHTDLTVNFQPGMTVIRALNEQGKSTLLEAIAYAMFGVKAIRDTLDDCVTWGEAPTPCAWTSSSTLTGWSSSSSARSPAPS